MTAARGLVVCAACALIYGCTAFTSPDVGAAPRAVVQVVGAFPWESFLVGALVGAIMAMGRPMR